MGHMGSGIGTDDTAALSVMAGLCHSDNNKCVCVVCSVSYVDDEKL